MKLSIIGLLHKAIYSVYWYTYVFRWVGRGDAVRESEMRSRGNKRVSEIMERECKRERGESE
jgi:hypothetical protein